MLGWLKKWREPPVQPTLTPDERRARWAEQGRKERVFLDSLEKKLSDNFPVPEPEAEPADSAALVSERFKTDRGSREPHFGDIDRLAPLEHDGFEREPPVQALVEDSPPLREEPLVRYADRYQKLEADLRTAAATPAVNGRYTAAERRAETRASPGALNAMLRAVLFAAERHKNQRRKGAGRDPYINHLLEVAALLADATDGEDTELIIAGLLHEAMDDQDGVDEIAAQFGPGVTNLVAELADDRRRGMSEQRPVKLEPLKSRRAQMIKIAELISHVRALNISPPTDWPLERRRDYFLWAQRVVAGCRDASPRLEAIFDGACARGLEALKHLH